MAFSELHGSLVAGVAEVSADGAGKINVHNFWMAVDPGIALQPHNIVAQMESNIIYGLSQSIKEQVTLENGAVQQSNFHDYEVFRMADVPNIEVKVMPQGGVYPVRSARWDCRRRRARSPMPCAPLTVPI